MIYISLLGFKNNFLKKRYIIMFKSDIIFPVSLFLIIVFIPKFIIFFIKRNRDVVVVRGEIVDDGERNI
tara:strand:- start:34 stop:240 length:207 start_codon:yes stop_codon:yes gene_type:complete